jgi:histidyl-tRNA synthetase
MAVRNWIIDGWKKVSVRNGFEEYDGPIFEYLKMFQIKSGDEIVEQLFSLKDRGGRDLAIRPEITPTLARMVNQQINSLPRPIKWFSVPRLCRAERPQKGRLREFFQWNIDIIGVDDVLADAEVIFTTADYLREVGLTAKDVKIKMSSRKLLAAVLEHIGIAEQRLDSMYALLDKKAKLPADTFREMLNEQVADSQKVGKIESFMNLTLVSEVEKMFGRDRQVKEAFDELAMLMHWLGRMGVAQYCQFDPSIVRGLAYYTGPVFEVHDVKGDLRAIGGGGRFDNLLHDFGGPDIPATGMGMGDCVLEILLRGRDLLDEKKVMNQLDFFVISVTAKTRQSKDGAVTVTAEDTAVHLTAELRRRGFSADFSYKSTGLAKHLKEAAGRHAQRCIIVGDEFIDRNELVVKDMDTGEQELVNVDDFLSQAKP